MLTSRDIKPIRRSILITVLGFVFCFVSIAIFYIANVFLQESQQQAEQGVQLWSKYVIEVSRNDLVNDQSDTLTEKLNHFNIDAAFKLIEIYKLADDGEKLSLFARYNPLRNYSTSGTSGSAQLTPTISQENLNGFLTPSYQGDIIKLLAPINYQDVTIGYAYIEIDSHEGLNFSNHLLIIFVALFFILTTLVSIVIMRLESTITNPLREISAEVLHIAQTKDYSLRLNSMAYKEADIVARNINNMLNRIERHVTQLGLAEQQSLKLNIELEDKVASRTQALKESNQELLSTLEQLHQFQDQLVESEKMASLGDMVAGVAHEVNTPIGLGVTASTLLSDRLNEIKKAFDDKTLKSSQLNKFLTEGQENVGIVYRNLKRAAELISSFKKVAVDQSSDEFRQFNFHELINEVLLTLAPQIKNTPYKVSFDCPEDLIVVSKPGPVNQILINLIMNSMAHGFDGRDYGDINIHVKRTGEQLHLTYQDDGKGIAESIREKVFDPFTTTKRGEGGSGLGLHLVYNLVTQALGGNIRLHSEQNKGVTFEIHFPISEQLL